MLRSGGVGVGVGGRRVRDKMMAQFSGFSDSKIADRGNDRIRWDLAWIGV